MDKLRKVMGGDDTETSVVSGVLGNSVSLIYFSNDTYHLILKTFPEVGDNLTLGWGTRIKGFIICFAIGFVCSLLGSFLLFIPKKGLILFAVFYTVGNLLSIGSTCFLMGPAKQCKKMMAETRIIATIVMFVFMFLTLSSALWWKITVLALVFCILQFVALTWYSISYIPFARTAVKKCICSCRE